MNSADRKGKALKPRSPWSDGDPRRSTPTRPPRTPTRYIYHDGAVVSSPAFDSLGTRTQRKREARSNNNNDTQSPEPPKNVQHSNESPPTPSNESPLTPSSLSPRSLEAPKTSPKVSVPHYSQEKEKETKQEPSQTPKTHLPRLSITSPSNASEVSSLNASSEEFVPSVHTLSNMGVFSSRAVQCPISQVLPGMNTNTRQTTRHQRYPEGEDLNKMVSVLLHIVDTTPPKYTPMKKKVFALYPYQPHSAGRAPIIRSKDDSALVNERVHHSPLRFRTRSA